MPPAPLLPHTALLSLLSSLLYFTATAPTQIYTLSLHDALPISPVTPGSTIWLRGGRYTGGSDRAGFRSNLTGTADAPIVVRQFPGERAIVTNSLDVRGSYAWFWGFEVTSARQAATGTDYEYLVGAHAGTANRLRNLVIHDGPNTGVASFTPLYTSASQTTIYGCLIYNNGTHVNLDHGLYLQNDVATGTVTVTDNIVFNNEAFGLHIYSRA